MPELHETRTGQKFYEQDIPQIAQSLEAIAQEQVKANRLKERELELKEEELKIQRAASQKSGN